MGSKIGGGPTKLIRRVGKTSGIGTQSVRDVMRIKARVLSKITVINRRKGISRSERYSWEFSGNV